MNSLNTTQTGILSQVAAGHNTLADVAEQLGVKTQVVTGNLASLKKRHLVEYSDGHLSLTEEGAELVEDKEVEVAVAAPVVESAEEVIEAIIKTVVAEVAAKKEKPVKVTKKQQAVGIIESMAGARRKDIVAELVSVMDITANNAGAYIQNHRAEQGIVVHREKKEVGSTEE